MDFIEHRILGIQIDESGRECIVSIAGPSAARYNLTLNNVERLLVTEMRQQNVIEEVIHYEKASDPERVQQAAIALVAVSNSASHTHELDTAVQGLAAKVIQGETEMLEITAVYGAQLLASFESMSVVPLA